MSRPGRDVVVRGVLAAAVVGLFAAPYLAGWYSPWRYVAADVLIALGVLAVYRGDALRRLGFAIPLRHLGIALAVFGAVWFGSRELVTSLAEQAGVEVRGRVPGFSLSQVVHQEIVMRALFLGALIGVVRSPWALAAGAAVVFTAVHPALFWLVEGTRMPPATLVTLFCFATATNYLYVRFRHVGLSLAVHAGWNLARFGDSYRVGKGWMSEAGSFAVFEGAAPTVLAAVVLLAAVWSWDRFGPSVGDRQVAPR